MTHATNNEQKMRAINVIKTSRRASNVGKDKIRIRMFIKTGIEFQCLEG